MDKRLERILPRVQKPARYAGGEYNAVVKNKEEVDVRFAFCFPDTYEIGMSNLGFRILYGIMNEMPGVWCERCFTPWGDMEEELRAAKILACEVVPKAKKLLKLQVDLGYERRQIVSGIAKFYSPEDLIGKKVIIVANLAPATLCGVESQGMLLASGEEEIRVVFLDDSVKLGDRIH